MLCSACRRTDAFLLRRESDIQIDAHDNAIKKRRNNGNAVTVEIWHDFLLPPVALVRLRLKGGSGGIVRCGVAQVFARQRIIIIASSGFCSRSIEVCVVEVQCSVLVLRNQSNQAESCELLLRRERFSRKVSTVSSGFHVALLTACCFNPSNNLRAVLLARGG